MPADAPNGLLDREVVDLSLALAEDLPCTWPSHMPYRHTVHKWFDGDARTIAPGGPEAAGYYTAWLVIDEHAGTHVDAPIHAIAPTDAAHAAASAVDQIPLGRLSGAARVIDVSALLEQADEGRSPLITREHVDAHEAEHGRLAEGDIVLFRTGWDRRYLAGEAGAAYALEPRALGRGPGWTAPEPETILLLLGRGVRCVGTDAPTIAPLHDPVPVHRVGLEAGIVYVEGLTNLYRLPPSRAVFVCLPLKIVGGSGAPARAVAFLPRADGGT